MTATRPFSFGPANPARGTRGIDSNARMWIRITVEQAIAQCVGEDRRWNPIDVKGGVA